MDIGLASGDFFTSGPGVLLGSLALALITVPSVLLRRRGRPAAALSWLLALFALPGLGFLCWWAFGRTHLERKKRKRVRKRQFFSQTRTRTGQPTRTTLFDQQMPRRALGECVFSSAGNQVALLLDGGAAFAAMEDAIRRARRTVHVAMYIWQSDATGRIIRDLLAERAREGVQVRVLVDGFGARGFVRRLGGPLLAAGAEVGVFLPSRFTPFWAPRTNFVNHRKILVVDGEVAFTGGMNVGDEYKERWRDAMVKIDGPAVQDLDHVFLDDWYFATEKLVDVPERAGHLHPDGVDLAIIASGPDSEAWIHDAYFLALTQAQSRIWIATPYFIPGPAIQAALRTAAGRGVDVRIIVPSDSDVAFVTWASRSYYRLLVYAGVRIFEYESTMLHAKALIIDDMVGSVGTANIDSRSFRLSFEVGCFFASRALNRELAAWHEALLQDATEITRETVDQKPVLTKLAESVAHLCSPIL